MCFVLGAGASHPHFPLAKDLPDLIAKAVGPLNYLSVNPQQDTALRRLLQPERWLSTNTREGWEAAQMTSGTVGLALSQCLATARRYCPPQYRVFSLFSRTATVISFNWDGLARKCCPQRSVIHVHGYHRLRPFGTDEFRELLDWAQLDEDSDDRIWVPRLILPGEEDRNVSPLVRGAVESIWRGASRVAVIGYGFGMPGDSYDLVWREAFIEMMKRNSSADIHIVMPDPEPLTTELRDRLRSYGRVHTHAKSWQLLAEAVLHLADSGVPIPAMIRNPQLLRRVYDRYQHYSERLRIE